MRIKYVLMMLLISLLTSCGGGDEGGGAGGAGSGGRSAADNSTEVTVLLSKPKVATGAIGAQGYVPPGVQSMVVDVYKLDGTHLQGPFYANVPILNATFVAPNGSYDVRVYAFSGVNGTGIRWYDGAQNVTLSGQPMLMTLKMNMKVTASAAANVISPGQSVTLTGQEAGQAPGANSPLIWRATDSNGVAAGAFSGSAGFGGTIVWTPPNIEGNYTLTAQVDPVANPDQDPTYVGNVSISVQNQAPVVSFANASVAVGTGAVSPAIVVVATDPDPLDVVTIALAATAPAWATLDPVAQTLVLSPPSTLSVGNYSIPVVATDSFGVTASSTLTASIFDATAPFTPTFNPVSSPNKQVQPVISGLAEPNTSMTIYDAGVVLGSAAVNGLGNWSFVPAIPFVDAATVVLTAVATDIAGNVSPISAALSFLVDTTAPIAPIVSTPIAGILAALPSISGSAAEVGSTITISHGAIVLGTATVNAGLTWTLNPAALSDGIYQLSATATDIAGNESVASAPITLTLDTTAPTAPVMSVFTTSPSNNNTSIIAGVAEAGSLVSIFKDGVAYATVNALADGSWSYTPALALADGSYVFTATATDSVANVSIVSAAALLAVDTIVPANPVITSPATGATIASNVPTITGTAEANTLISLTGLGTTNTDAAGNWTFTPVSPLSNNVATTINVTASDAAGNVSAIGSIIVTVSVPVPVVPVVTTAAATVNTSTPTVAGTAPAGSTVNIISNGQIVASVQTNAAGVWTAPLTTAVVNGAVLEAAVLSAGGNVSTPVAIPLTINAPLPTTTLLVAGGATTSTSAIPVVTGVTSPYATVTIVNAGVTVATVVADALGNFNAPISAALANGAVNLTATVVDTLGNTSAVVAGNAVVIDTIAPNIAVLTTASAIVTTSTPTLTGTGEANASVSILNFGVALATTTVDAAGNWTLVLPALADGQTALTVFIQDAAGNSSTASAA
ncbi:MAG: Ig-like domain-containing protein, partial [Mariprofundaceae bacterium]|nr:Ig-like domain-containing protein [Mariprofundaceae bacterium]